MDLKITFVFLCIKSLRQCDNLGPRGQFHQHFMLTFFVQKCFLQLSLDTFQVVIFGAKISAQNERVKC